MNKKNGRKTLYVCLTSFVYLHLTEFNFTPASSRRVLIKSTRMCEEIPPSFAKLRNSRDDTLSLYLYNSQNLSRNCHKTFCLPNNRIQDIFPFEDLAVEVQDLQTGVLEPRPGGFRGLESLVPRAVLVSRQAQHAVGRDLRWRHLKPGLWHFSNLIFGGLWYCHQRQL